MHRKKDGTVFPVEIVRSYFDYKGRRINVSAIRDITERKRAEERINYLASIVESSDDAIIGKSMDERIISWNKGAERIYGYTAEEMIGKSISILIPADKHNDLTDIMARLKRGETTEHHESVRVRRDGQRIYVSLTISPIKDSNGRIIGASTIARDVTEHKRMEDALLKSETKYRVVADNTYDFEYWVNPQGRFIYASPSCKRITGHTPEEFLNNPDLCRRIIHPDDLDNFDRHVEEDEKQHKTNEVEWRMIHADGSIHWIVHACQPIYSDQGDYLGVRGSNRDISERKRAIEELQQMQAHLAHVARLSTMGEMVAGIAHEVNQPLYSILNYAKACNNILAQDTPTLDKLRKWNNNLVAEAVRAGEIIKRLRDFVHKSELNRLPADINEVVGESLAIVASETRRCHISEKMQFSDANPLVLIIAFRFNKCWSICCGTLVRRWNRTPKKPSS